MIRLNDMLCRIPLIKSPILCTNAFSIMDCVSTLDAPKILVTDTFSVIVCVKDLNMLTVLCAFVVKVNDKISKRVANNENLVPILFNEINIPEILEYNSLCIVLRLKTTTNKGRF